MRQGDSSSFVVVFGSSDNIYWMEFF